MTNIINDFIQQTESFYDRLDSPDNVNLKKEKQNNWCLVKFDQKYSNSLEKM